MTRHFYDDKREFARIDRSSRSIIRRDQNNSSDRAIFNHLNVIVSIYVRAIRSTSAE